MDVRQLPIPNAQLPATPNSQLPIESCWKLEVGSWEWLGRWKLVVGSSLAALSMASAACGKKGPPLAPIVHIPAAVETVEAKRRGNEVSLTVTVPAKNIDGSAPVDISRIEIYGYTGNLPPPRSRFLEVGTLVGTITVPEQKPDAPPAAAPPPGTPVPGGRVTIQESLTADTLVAKPIPPAPVTTRDPRPLPTLPTTAGAAAETGPLRRFYFALPFSPRGRPGPPGMISELKLTVLPEPPLDVKAANLADSIRLEWEPSGGLLGLLLERGLPPELSPLDDPEAESAGPPPGPAPLQGPTRYNVYREIAPLEGTTPPAEPITPALLNAAPLETPTFIDPVVALDGRKRCYVVRSVRGEVEGVPSEPPTCVVPSDDVAPEPPAGLTVTATEGEIMLNWQPNAEPDVAGYLILRGEAGDATLTPVTDTVVTEVRFTDRTVRPGVRYVYAVQAIDSRLPRPNVSGESAREEVTAR
jgi:hypothetical protein